MSAQSTLAPAAPAVTEPRPLAQAGLGDRIRYTPAAPGPLDPVLEGVVTHIFTTAPRAGHRYHLHLDRRCPGDGSPVEARIYDNTGGRIDVLIPCPSHPVHPEAA